MKREKRKRDQEPNSPDGPPNKVQQTSINEDLRTAILSILAETKVIKDISKTSYLLTNQQYRRHPRRIPTPPATTIKGRGHGRLRGIGGRR